MLPGSYASSPSIREGAWKSKNELRPTSTASHASNHANGTPNGQSAEEAEDRALMEQFLLNPAHDYRNLQYGDAVDGTIMRVDKDEILVDIGSKAEGVVPAREMQSLTPEDRAELQPGQTLLVFVVQSEDQRGPRRSFGGQGPAGEELAAAPAELR